MIKIQSACRIPLVNLRGDNNMGGGGIDGSILKCIKKYGLQM
jgi:hypothetical protein